MKIRTIMIAVSTLVLASPFALQAATVNINFDEFTSPPVTCCFGSTGVTGPLVYPDVTVADGANSGFVMDFSGWSNMQTSGNNLFGTLSGSMVLTFNSAVSALSVDVINGSSAGSFTLTLFDQSNTQIFQSVFGLNGFGTAGSVATQNPATVGIWKAEILGTSDFAIDTVSFDTSLAAVPEPSTLAMMATALAAVGLRRLRRRV